MLGRVVGFIAVAIVIGVVTNLVLHRVLVGMLVAGGILLVGLFMLIGRPDPSGPER